MAVIDDDHATRTKSTDGIDGMFKNGPLEIEPKDLGEKKKDRALFDDACLKRTLPRRDTGHARTDGRRHPF